MSDENCRENRGGGPKHVQGGRQQKRGLQMGGVRPWSGDSYEEGRNTGCANGVRTAGQESSLGSESTIYSESKACGKAQWRRRR